MQITDFKINMIRICKKSDFHTIFKIINDAAQTYKGVIPEDCWNEPYMPFEELKEEIENGVVFWGWEREAHSYWYLGSCFMGNLIL